MDAAQLIWISELLSSQFLQTDDSPSTILTPHQERMSRVRVHGIVVSDNELVVDDGSGSILVKSFEQHLPVTIGDPVLVIGRPRKFNDEYYLVGEIVKHIDPLWIEWAKKRRPQRKPLDPLHLVRELDAGDGADYDHVVSKLGDKGEETITHLLAMGELFETRPGKLKVLE